MVDIQDGTMEGRTITEHSGWIQNDSEIELTRITEKRWVGSTSLKTGPILSKQIIWNVDRSGESNRNLPNYKLHYAT